MAIVIVTDMEKLPDYCTDCPFMNDVINKCQADPGGRSSVWRPFWCPLEEVEVEYA